ncbi:helix-turn-helix transcriptional regulator [Rhodococcus opacus]|uniref:helix-turn-helix transcriptional regulator n=1 Tax=Rhodococcus opacus TaxID=37919 RepID=UPI001C4893EC|nr:LuxR family transcriptional regulator [Rhodococcus opacus]MBV6755212.1 AAA family ATPase [Rhodococcus opacus]
MNESVFDCAIERLSAGAGSTYLILGEAGTGKTHLLRSTIDAARRRGWTCLYAAAHEYDRDIPYATVRTLVGVHGHTAVPSDPNGVTALLQSMTDSSPVVVVVDDAHLADEDSLVAVTLAARHLAGRPLLVIFASRTRPWTTGERLVATIGHLVSEQARTILELRPVEGQALGELVESVLGAVPDERLTGYLTERTRGNALLVRETVNALRTAGAVRIEQGIGYLVDDSPPRFPRPAALLHRLFPGDHAVRALGRLVAVFGRVDLDYLPLLAELAERSPGEVRAVFDSLVARGALVPTGSGWYEFGHPLIGELLYDEIGPAERRRVHAAIAARIEGTDPELGMPALERARHVTEGAARGDTAAITVALRAADRTLCTSPRTAARWYGRALDLLPRADAAAGEILGTQSAAYWKGSRPALAIEAGSQALGVLEAGPSRDRTAATIVHCHNAMGDPQSAADLLVAEAGQARDSTPSLAQRAAMSARLGDTDQARVLAAAAWSQVRDSTPADQVIAYTYLGQVEASVGTFPNLLEAVDRLEILGTGERELPVGTRTGALESAALHAATAGATGRANALLTKAGDAAGLAGFGNLGGQAVLARALAEFTTGDWTAASETIAREAVHLEFSGMRSALARLRCVEVQILTGRGDFRRAVSVLAATKPPASCRIDFAVWQAVQASVEVSRSRCEDAIPVLERLRSEAGARGWNEVGTITHASLVEGYLARGEVEAAGRVADEFCRLAENIGTPAARMASGIGHALSFGDVDRARDVLLEAEEQGLHYIAARAHHALGVVGRGGADHLEAAWALFKKMDATLWLKRVEAAGRSRGLVLDRRVDKAGAPGPLTDVERHLVTLVRDGLSNRQIAEVLHYSSKTVEAYLTRLYKKTGYNSRVELIVAHERADSFTGR